MEFNNLTKKELIEILENLKKVLAGDTINQNNQPELNTTQQSDLENLIGTVPFLLLNQQIFEKNQDIADFAKRLNIDIPGPEKKKREDIIGRVVSAIASFDHSRIAELNKAIKAIKNSDIKKGKSNFFRDWENVIKQMKI